MIYIKKYYRKIGIILIPLIILILVIYSISIKNKAPTNDDIDELLLNNESQPTVSNDIKVNIKGAVVNPGVYSFTSGERVIDAINKSGGLLETADTSVINLSKNLFDEMVIVIYTYDEVQAMKGNNILIQYVERECNCPKLENDACLVDNDTGNNLNNDNFINQKVSINTASIEQLQTLSGIGESKANAIIKYREEHGNFTKIEDIMNVTGIGEKVFEQIKDSITV